MLGRNLGNLGVTFSYVIILVDLVSPVSLVCLVCLVYLVCLVSIQYESYGLEVSR